MTAKKYKIIIGILLVLNITCLITIYVLCGEINLLQDNLSKLSDTLQVLNEKIAYIELVQENFRNGQHFQYNQEVVEQKRRHNHLGGFFVFFEACLYIQLWCKLTTIDLLGL